MFMSLDYILEQLQVQIQIGLAALSGKNQSVNQTDMIILAVIAAVGVLFCFLGLKMVRFWAAIFGLLVGVAGGFYLSVYFGLEGYVPLIIAGVAGIILAVLGVGFYRAGVFLVGWILGIAGSAYAMQPKDWKMALICVAIGLVIGLITLKFAEPVTILVTSVFGGFFAGQAAYIMLPVTNHIIGIAIIIVLVILGIIIQFLLESRKRKRLHLKKAEEIRNKNSVENEVDKARAMMENLEREPDVADNLAKDSIEDAIMAETGVINLDEMDDDYDDELDDDEFADQLDDDEFADEFEEFDEEKN